MTEPTVAEQVTQLHPIISLIVIRRGLKVASIPVEGTDELRYLTDGEAKDLRRMVRSRKPLESLGGQTPIQSAWSEATKIATRAGAKGWSGIIAWLKEHWAELLKILLALLPLFILSERQSSRAWVAAHRLVLPLALVLLLCWPAYGQEPTLAPTGPGQGVVTVHAAVLAPEPLAIDGPKTAVVGELVVLQAVAVDAVNVAWTPDPPTKDFRRDADGRAAVFSARAAGTVKFYVSAASATGELWQTLYTLTVTGPEPPEPPMPPADPLAAKVRQWTQAIPLPARAVAPALAEVYAQAATGAAAGRWQTVEALMADLASKSTAAIGANRPAWTDWAAKISGELDALWDAGQLPDVAAYATPLNSIAGGLR